MTRKLRALGLVLLGCMAVAGANAAGASAKYDSEVEKTWIHGTSTSNYTFTTNVGTVTCKKTTTVGVSVGVNVGVSTYTSQTGRAAPTYTECTAFGFPAEVKVNGCQYELLEPTEFQASTKIVCPIGKQIEIVAFGFCTMTVGSQSPGGKITMTNEGTGSTRTVKGSDALTSMVYGGTCGSGNNGTYSGTGVLKGFSDEAMTKQVGVWVTK